MCGVSLERSISAPKEDHTWTSRLTSAQQVTQSDYRLALESGKGVTEYQPFEPAANEIRSIWTWLRDELAIAKTDPDSRTAVA
jgi:hypothetical protein